MPKEWKKNLLESTKILNRAEKPTDPHESTLFAAEMGNPPEIDLHGMTVDEAICTLEAFIHHQLMQRTEAVRIIHGKGYGQLEAAVKKWLHSQTELITKFRGAVQNVHEQGAVTYAALTDIKPPKR